MLCRENGGSWAEEVVSEAKEVGLNLDIVYLLLIYFDIIAYLYTVEVT